MMLTDEVVGVTRGIAARDCRYRVLPCLIGWFVPVVPLESTVCDKAEKVAQIIRMHCVCGDQLDCRTHLLDWVIVLIIWKSDQIGLAPLLIPRAGPDLPDHARSILDGSSLSFSDERGAFGLVPDRESVFRRSSMVIAPCMVAVWVAGDRGLSKLELPTECPFPC